MRKKIIPLIILAGMLLATTQTLAQTNNRTSSSPVMFDDGPPTWEVGNSWTYAIDSFIVNYSATGMHLSMDGVIDDFTWTVTDTTGDYYTVGLTGKITGDYSLYLSSPQLTLYVIGTLQGTRTKLTGSLVFTKSDLELHDISIELKGISSAKIDPLPFSLPIPFKLTMNGDLSVDFPLFDFPLSANKFWNLPNVVINMAASVGGIFGLIKIPITLGVEYSFLPLAFHCVGQESVTVPAGTYNAYKIKSFLFDYFQYYYAPAAGNIVKIDATLFSGEVHGELIDTTYS